MPGPPTSGSEPGSVLVGAKLPAGKPFALALATLAVIALIGLLAAFLIPG